LRIAAEKGIPLGVWGSIGGGIDNNKFAVKRLLGVGKGNMFQGVDLEKRKFVTGKNHVGRGEKEFERKEEKRKPTNIQQIALK